MFDTEKYIDTLLAGDLEHLPKDERAFALKLREQDAAGNKIKKRLAEIEAQQRQLAAEQQQLAAQLNRVAGACAALADVLTASAQARLPEMELREAPEPPVRPEPPAAA